MFLKFAVVIFWRIVFTAFQRKQMLHHHHVKWPMIVAFNLSRPGIYLRTDLFGLPTLQVTHYILNAGIMIVASEQGQYCKGVAAAEKKTERICCDHFWSGCNWGKKITYLICTLWKYRLYVRVSINLACASVQSTLKIWKRNLSGNKFASVNKNGLKAQYSTKAILLRMGIKESLFVYEKWGIICIWKSSVKAYTVV